MTLLWILAVLFLLALCAAAVLGLIHRRRDAALDPEPNSWNPNAQDEAPPREVGSRSGGTSRPDTR